MTASENCLDLLIYILAGLYGDLGRWRESPTDPCLQVSQRQGFHVSTAELVTPGLPILAR